jgi:hypothetical protein
VDPLLPTLLCALTAGAGSGPERVALGAIPVGTGDLVYEVSGGACDGKRPLEVRVLRRGGVLKTAGTVPAPWPIPCDLRKPARKGGVPSYDWEARGIDEIGAEQWAALRVRKVRLGAGLQAVLLEQAAGIEHVVRSQALVALVGGRLRKLWEEQESAAPTVVSVEILPGPGSTDQIRFARALDWGLESRQSPDPDHYEAELLRWNQARRRLDRAPAPLWAAVFGAEADIPAARSVAAGFVGKCANLRPLVVEAGAFPKLRADRPFVIARFLPDERAAGQVRTRAKDCKAPTLPTLKRAR